MCSDVESGPCGRKMTLDPYSWRQDTGVLITTHKVLERAMVGELC